MSVPETFLDGKITLLRGDCLERLRELEENSIDSCVTDPPYGIGFMGKDWDVFKGDNRSWTSMGVPTGVDSNLHTARPGAMTAGKYDLTPRGMKGFQDFTHAWASLAIKTLKPGAHLLCFCSTRTYHRMAYAIEDAGFEIRDQIGWCYGSGFPKNHNVGNGWGTALKPAWDPLVLARKPLSEKSVAANVLRWGTGAINIGGCRVATNGEDMGDPHRFANCREHEGWSRPSHTTETIKKRGERMVAAPGRWPANLIHDGSEEVLAGFPDSDGQQGALRGTEPSGTFSKVSSGPLTRQPFEVRGDSGSAARFFYTAKADSDDRLGSKHPTVKPLDLMQYLVRLITPRGGLTLDPFAGTGTLGEASWRERFRAILIEREPEYQADIVKRVGLCLAGPDQRRAATVKQESIYDLPMFARLEL